MLKLKFLLFIAAAAAVSAVPAPEAAGHATRDEVRCHIGCHPDGERLRCGDGVGIGWVSSVGFCSRLILEK